MGVYDPGSRADRAALADALLAMFAGAGFIEADTGTIERVFARPHHRLPGARVLVYSTIDGTGVRACARFPSSPSPPACSGRARSGASSSARWSACARSMVPSGGSKSAATAARRE